MHKLSAFLTLLISYISIIILCTLIIGILSCQIMNGIITHNTISSNNKLLNQYKSSIDLAVIDAVDDISVKIMRDLNNNFYLNRYFNDPLENSIADISMVSKYLNDILVLNPLIFSLSIYYSNSNLLISTEYIRHTLYKPLESQNDLKHYYDIVQKAADIVPDNLEHVSLIFDYGKNLGIKSSEIHFSQAPENIIHAVRLSSGYNEKIKGAVIVTISGDICNNFINKYAPEDLGSIFIFNQQGIIISHSDNKYIGQNISELQYNKKLLETNNKPGHFTSELDGTPVVVSYQPSVYGDWTYVSLAPMESISSVTKYMLRIISLITLLSVFVGIIASVVQAKRIVKPIESIANYCIKSPYFFNQVKGNNEYALISGTINNMENIMKEKEEELKKVRPVLIINFLNSLLSEEPPDSAEIDARMKMLNIAFPFKNFCASAIKLERLQSSEKVVLYEYEKLNIYSKIYEVFSTVYSRCIFYEKDNLIAVIYNFDFEEEELYHLGNVFLKQTLKQTSEHILKSKYLSFGKIDSNIKNMNISFKEALNGLNYAYVFPEKYLFTYKNIVKIEKEHSTFNRLLLNNLENSLKSFNREKSITDLEILIKTLKNEVFSYQQIHSVLVTCASMIEDYTYTQDGGENGLVQDFEKTSNILEYEALAKEIIFQGFESMEKTVSNNKMLVKRALDYIEQNIQNTQLSLEHVAGELGISHKYLSKVFKNETGVKFIDYLTNLKLNHCRSLLINTDLKVEEISDIMGYSTSHYFISRFKMMFGYTPKKYREKFVCSNVNE